jgi:pimeloyl-ACP methyl ester carboxylesterase
LSTVAGGGGIPLNVVETGNPAGPAILFVHGMSQSYLAWLPQLRSSLARTHRLVAFDLRGHGGSAKPWRPEDYADSRLWADDIAAVIAATGLERPVIVAWSYGGHAVLSYVRHYGTGQVGALDFTGTLAGLKQVERQPGPDTEHLMAGSKLRASRDLEENIDGYRQMADGLTAEPLPPDLDRIAFLTGLLHPGYVRRAMLSLPTQNADLAARLDVPVLLSMGRHDREWPIAACEQVAAMLPDARLSVYERSGHFPSAEDSGRFNAELASLVERRRR